MADIQVNFQDEQPIHVDVTYDQINVDFNDRPIDISIEDAQPISVDLENAQPIAVNLGDAVNIYYGEGGNDKHFVYQFTNAAEITVPHLLNKRPSVAIEDSAGDEVEAEVEYINLNRLLVRFSAPFTGRVICN